MIKAYLGKDATSDWQEIHKMEHLEKHMHSLKKMGRIKANGGLLSWLWGRVGTSEPPMQKSSQEAVDNEEAQDEDGAEAENEVEPVRWNAMHEAELPVGGVFDVQELSRWDC